ncbi:MAG: site-2 protease family protein [Sedimentisphaerales bacterium]|nr:site-2 protease family protein [Sedimentisphaerales bacterium]
MTDEKHKNEHKTEQNPTNSDHSKPKNNNRNITILLAFLALAIYFIVSDPERAKNIALMLLGFGAVIFVHELGHFFSAKAVGIEVEAFSLGMGPNIFGFKRVPGGFQVRIFPELIPGHDGKGALHFVNPKAAAKPGETEYRLALIPFGGYVKMLGQEDIAADKPSDNPRAFGNKPVWQRVIVISAGVIMNVISAAIVFMLVFAKGVELPPAVAGFVWPDSPAAVAGIKGGDEIIAINGKKNINFIDLKQAAAFADQDESVELQVRHPDGSENIYNVIPGEPKTALAKKMGLKVLGIGPSYILTLNEKITEKPILTELKKLGLRPGDTVTAVNGEPISHYYQLHPVLHPDPGTKCANKIQLTIQRSDANKNPVTVNTEINMAIFPAGSEPGQILGMVPRIKIPGVGEDSPAKQAGVEPNDIILRYGSITNPTLEEIIEVCKLNVNQPVELLVLRQEKNLPTEKLLSVTPQYPEINWLKRLGIILTTDEKDRQDKFKPAIGIGVDYDLNDPIVASCITTKSIPRELPIPRGATITALNDQPVENWKDIIVAFMENQQQQVKIAYLTPDGQLAESITVDLPDNHNWLGYGYAPDLGHLAFLPLEDQQKLFQGKNILDSLRMGTDLTYSFIGNTYLTIKGMLNQNIKLSSAMGPVGIMKISYTIAQKKSLTYYCYFMAMISVCIAVFNFLPLPILDGGYIVMLIIEKIKGSPVSTKVQEFVTYAGLILIGSLFLVITYHDIIRLITGVL